MRIALISDIHGNPIALDAVLGDLEGRGVDQTWFLGDFAAIGPEPALTLERVAQVPNARCIRGNTDRYTCTGDGPPPTADDVRKDPSQVELYGNIAASFAWTRGAIIATGWFDWLARLPLEIRETIEGTRILAVHASPGTDDGVGIHPGQSNAEVARLLEGCDADIVIVGHTHEAMVRRLDTVTLVNLGSVSNPRSGDRRASYAILDVTAAEVSVEHHRVGYDHQAFAARLAASHHPAAAFIAAHQRGEVLARPPHADHTAPIPGVRVRLREATPPSRPGAS